MVGVVVEGSREVGLDGKMMGPDRVERGCRLTERRGAELVVAVADGEGAGGDGRTIVYLDLVGRVEGEGRWTSPDRLTLVASGTPARLERLSRQLDVVAAMPPEGRSDHRGSRRVIPVDGGVEIMVGGGTTLRGVVRDMSRSGAAVGVVGECFAGIATGSVVTIGRTRGRVVRPLAGGFAVEFSRMLPLEEFGEAYRL